MDSALTPHEVLKKYWGYDSFRPLQEDIVRAVLDGRDALALLPTGGGKSICFQVPGMILPGLCLVVSPLIALMKDQVMHLKEKGIEADAIFSGMSASKIDSILTKAQYGQLKFLYVSPERLQTEVFQLRLGQMKVGLLAVDEAHCISQWGYDFRPPYLKIADLRPFFEGTPILALTATATEKVVEDIQERLLFKAKNVFRQGFERKNLRYVVLPEKDKFSKLLDIVRKVPGTGLVYVRNRKRTQDLAQRLIHEGVPADFYHAGLPPDERDAKQLAWMENRVRIMVCTNAFGMGIDKSGVRTVVHLDLPDSLEAYFQEAGRAGRDGKTAYAVLLYDDTDKDSLEYNFANGFPEPSEIRRVYQALSAYYQVAVGPAPNMSFDFDLAKFLTNFKLEALPTHAALRILELEGWISITDPGRTPATVQILASRETLYDYQLRNKELDKLLKAMMRGFHNLFEEPRTIDTARFARTLPWELEKLEAAFARMHREGIILYTPTRLLPQLEFLQYRVEPKNLDINHQLLAFRKQRAREQLDAAIDYATLKVCRSKQLLRYFGDKTEQVCGQCDVCLKRGEALTDAETMERYSEKVFKLLQGEPLALRQILDAFASSKQHIVIDVLTWLLDEGKLIKDERERISKP